MSKFSRSGYIVDLIKKKVFPGTITIENGRIVSIVEDPQPKSNQYILPGFVDSHVHVESSMLIPSEFARLASVHGTVGTVSDPHEIGNVLGLEGIRFMINNGKKVPFHFNFGVSSCVPATSFETAGATIGGPEVEELFKIDHLKYLSEMMNYPGVIHNDPVVMEKIKIAKELGKPIDGHAPGLRGEEARKYIAAGISTDHECFRLEEALEKIKYGMKILIREGSAAKNYEALHSLIKSHPDKVMFCCDDKHPHELVEGHINLIVKRSIVEHGYDTMDVLRAASVNPIQHYKLEIGLLQPNDSADFIVVDNLKDFNVFECYVKGILIAKQGKTLISSQKEEPLNNFETSLKTVEDFATEEQEGEEHVIDVEDGQLMTKDLVLPARSATWPSIESDILKITVVNRYDQAKPAVAFVHNFGFKRGAIASCIAHDSHNIIAVGCSDREICEAVNLIIQSKGGISVVDGKDKHVLPLPVAGIMTNEDGYVVAKKYAEMDRLAKSLGTHLYAPFMTLSFMALLVIPELKLSDKGLFDGKKFMFINHEKQLNK